MTGSWWRGEEPESGGWFRVRRDSFRPLLVGCCTYWYIRGEGKTTPLDVHSVFFFSRFAVPKSCK